MACRVRCKSVASWASGEGFLFLLHDLRRQLNIAAALFELMDDALDLIWAQRFGRPRFRERPDFPMVHHEHIGPAGPVDKPAGQDENALYRDLFCSDFGQHGGQPVGVAPGLFQEFGVVATLVAIEAEFFPVEGHSVVGLAVARFLLGSGLGLNGKDAGRADVANTWPDSETRARLWIAVCRQVTERGSMHVGFRLQRG